MIKKLFKKLKPHNCIITEEDKQFVEKFAEENWVNFGNSNDRRTKQMIISNIIEGILGEIGFERIFKEYLILPNSIDKPLWYDYVAIDGRTIDVKTHTSEKPYQQRVYLPNHLNWADIFCLMYLDETNNKAYFKGSLFLDDCRKLVNDACYIDKELFVKNWR